MLLHYVTLALVALTVLDIPIRWYREAKLRGRLAQREKTLLALMDRNEP